MRTRIINCPPLSLPVPVSVSRTRGGKRGARRREKTDHCRLFYRTETLSKYNKNILYAKLCSIGPTFIPILPSGARIRKRVVKSIRSTCPCVRRAASPCPEKSPHAWHKTIVHVRRVSPPPAPITLLFLSITQ